MQLAVVENSAQRSRISGRQLGDELGAVSQGAQGLPLRGGFWIPSTLPFSRIGFSTLWRTSRLTPQDTIFKCSPLVAVVQWLDFSVAVGGRGFGAQEGLQRDDDRHPPSGTARASFPRWSVSTGIP